MRMVSINDCHNGQSLPSNARTCTGLKRMRYLCHDVPEMCLAVRLVYSNLYWSSPISILGVQKELHGHSRRQVEGRHLHICSTATHNSPEAHEYNESRPTEQSGYPETCLLGAMPIAQTEPKVARIDNPQSMPHTQECCTSGPRELEKLRPRAQA